MSGRRWMIPRMKCSTPLHLWRNDTWQKSYKEADSCSLLQAFLCMEAQEMVTLSHTMMQTGSCLQQPPSPTAVWTPMRQHIPLNLAWSELSLGCHNQPTLCTPKSGFPGLLLWWGIQASEISLYPITYNLAVPGSTLLSQLGRADPLHSSYLAGNMQSCSRYSLFLIIW